LNVLGIKHYLARVNKSQTNGEVERFFRTYKNEYERGSFDSIGQFVQHYNEERLNKVSPIEIKNF
jgi:transposase InsO family protein